MEAGGWQSQRFSLGVKTTHCEVLVLLLVCLSEEVTRNSQEVERVVFLHYPDLGTRCIVAFEPQKYPPTQLLILIMYRYSM